MWEGAEGQEVEYREWDQVWNIKERATGDRLRRVGGVLGQNMIRQKQQQQPSCFEGAPGMKTGDE